MMTRNSIENALKVKIESVEEEEAEEILPDLPEPSTHVKSEQYKAIPDSNTIHSRNQENSGITINDSSVLNKTLINVNGVLYFLEKIPESLVPKLQNESVVTHVEEEVHHTPVTDLTVTTATCPKCGKILKQPRNLRRHVLGCGNTGQFICVKCNYKTMSGYYWMQHTKQCGRSNFPPKEKKDRRANCLCICLKCNTSTLLYTSDCHKCGAKNYWQCKFCKIPFENWSKARRHLKTKCKPDCFYHCRKCHYRHTLRYYVIRHILRAHSECKPASNFIDQKKVSNDVNPAEHACSLCNKQFEDLRGLNSHMFICKKFELYSRVKCEKIEINKDVSQRDSSSSLDLITSYRQLIVRHCGTCNEDFELESYGVTLKKSCIKCSSILTYKCKKCGKPNELYDSLLRHVKAICDRREQFKCVQCNYTAYSMSRLTHHYKASHGDISATCTNCGSLFTNSSSFKKHIRRCGLATTLYCDMCPYTSTTKVSLIKHMRNHEDPLSALNISINNSDNNLASKNSSNVSGIQPYCTSCSRHQTTNHRLKYCKLCSEELQFRCSTCNKMFSVDDPHACEHVKNYLELLSLECKSCSKRFSNKDKYKLHEKSYCKAKYYRCKLCSYFTRYETYFRLHNRKEHQIRYKSRRFQNENDPQEIEMKIAKVLHLCKYCPYEAKTMASLQKHLKIHLANNGKSNSLSHRESNKETSNNAFDGDSKLNLQCKVVLTKLNMNSVYENSKAV